MIDAPFTILARIGGSSANHIMMAEEFIQLSKESSFHPCTIIAGHREGEHEDQIEIIVRYKHHRRKEAI